MIAQLAFTFAMKSCSYCGKESEDVAAACQECGTEFPLQSLSAGISRRSIDFREVLVHPIQLFRAIVAISLVSFAVWYFHLLAGGGLISEDTWDALSWHGYGAWLPMPPSVGWLVFFLYVVATIGLWMFSKAARLVFALLTGFSIALSILGGVQVQTALGSFLLLLTNMADGAILVMAYTPPLKDTFS